MVEPTLPEKTEPFGIEKAGIENIGAGRIEIARSPEEIAALVAARQEGGLGRGLRDMGVVAWRNILLEVRSPASILVSTLFAISLLLVFVASFAKVVSPDQTYADYAQFLLPFIIVQSLLFNTVNISNFFYSDLENGMDVRLRAMPIARFAAIGGRLLAAAARLLFQVFGIVLTGYLLGFRFQGGLLASLGFMVLPVFFTLGLTLWGFYIAVDAKSPEAVSAVLNPWLLPLTFFSIGYVPKSGFPNWAQVFVTYNPVSVASEAMRALANGEPAAGTVVIVLGWSAGLILFFGTLTVRRYQRRT